MSSNVFKKLLLLLERCDNTINYGILYTYEFKKQTADCWHVLSEFIILLTTIIKDII